MKIRQWCFFLTVFLWVFLYAACDNYLFDVGSPEVSIGDISSNTEGSLTFEVHAQVNTVVRVAAHLDSEFTDPGIISETMMTKNTQTMGLLGLNDDDFYYIRVQGENRRGEKSSWVYPNPNPFYSPQRLRNPLIDVIPLDGKLQVVLDAFQGTDITIQLSEERDFTSILAEEKAEGESKIQEEEIGTGTVENGRAYYIRIQCKKDDVVGSWYYYSTPVEPNPLGTVSIYRLSELAKIGQEHFPLDGFYTLKRDLDFMDADNNGYTNDPYDNDDNDDNGNWKPLGSFDKKFVGTFNGGGHSIKNMRINTPEAHNAGLFSYLYLGDDSSTNRGVIVNLGLLGAEVTGKNKVGGLVGEAGTDTSIVNSYIQGSVTGQSQTGGLVGLSYGTIRNSYVQAVVTAESDKGGGLVGELFGRIFQSYSVGRVLGGSYLGGAAGFLNGSTGSVADISYTYSTVEVSGETNVGGLVGGIGNDLGALLHKNLIIGTVKGDAGMGNVGRLAGVNHSTRGDFDENYHHENQGITGFNINTLTPAANSVTAASLMGEQWWYRSTGVFWEGATEELPWSFTDYLSSGYFPRLLRTQAFTEPVNNEKELQIPHQPFIEIPG